MATTRVARLDPRPGPRAPPARRELARAATNASSSSRAE
jgi:hypothetical protein